MNSQENLTILVLGTGGTIAGLSDDAGSKSMLNKGYRAAQLPVRSLIPESDDRILCEQIAQIDSKDMSFDIWRSLHQRLSVAMGDSALRAIVITHGTDTLEETAYFLHRTLACSKPVILTGAMRAADAIGSDGEQNMKFSIAQAKQLGAGVWVVFAGKVLSGGNVQKTHPTQLEAFDVIDQSLPLVAAQPLPVFKPLPEHWPRVEIVMSYAGASGELVEALIAQKVDGIVVAGSGDATLHYALESVLHKARASGIAVVLTTRCQAGRAVQARVELLLQLVLGA